MGQSGERRSLSYASDEMKACLLILGGRCAAGTADDLLRVCWYVQNYHQSPTAASKNAICMARVSPPSSSNPKWPPLLVR